MRGHWIRLVILATVLSVVAGCAQLPKAGQPTPARVVWHRIEARHPKGRLIRVPDYILAPRLRYSQTIFVRAISQRTASGL
jgi:hypothetical protein